MKTPQLQKTHDELSKQITSLRHTVIDNIRLFVTELGKRLTDEEVDTKGYLDLGKGIIVSSEDSILSESIVGVAIQDEDWKANPFMVDVEHQGPTAAYGTDELTIDTLLAILKSLEEMSVKDDAVLDVLYFN